MAKRLATEYVKTSLQLTEREFEQFVARFNDCTVSMRVKVCENGGQELDLYDTETEESLTLPFEKIGDHYVITNGTFRMTSASLAEVVRKAIVQYKGSGKVYRIYASFTIVYEYSFGKVVQIVERNLGEEKLIYEHHDSVAQLQHLYSRRYVEEKIQHTRKEIDKLLDLRNRVRGTKETKIVDRQLAGHVKKLFVLEA